jgi:hypothetical protein
MELDMSAIVALLTGPAAGSAVLFMAWRGERKERQELQQKLFDLSARVISLVERKGITA